MIPEDIIGKKFIAFKVKGKEHNLQYEESFGKEFTVLYFHPFNRKFVCCSGKISNNTEIMNYYPVQGIIDQLEEKQREEAMTLDDVINHIKQLTSSI